MTMLLILSWTVSAISLGVILRLLILQRREEARHAELAISNLLKASHQQKDVIFRNMHDHLNPMIRSVVRNIESHRLALQRNKLRPEAFERDIDVLLLALNDIRSCTHGEVPASLQNEGLMATLAEMLRRGAYLGIRTDFENRMALDKALPMDYLEQLEMYRICSELTENILKHSNCSFIRLTVIQLEESLVIDFTHDGLGISDAQAMEYMNSSRGVGLRSCMSRARLLNATLRYSSALGSMGVKLTVPVLWKNQLE